MTKQARIAIRLAEEDRAWLDEQADRLGLELSDVVRMLIRERKRSGVAVDPFGSTDVSVESSISHAAPQQRDMLDLRDATVNPRNKRFEHEIVSGGVATDPGLSYEDEPQVEEVDIPPDEDDDYPAPLVPARQPHQPAGYRFGRHRAASTPLAGEATRPAGVNPELAIGSSMGDGVGNVIKENFGHLGFRGGRR